jgi:poly(hydroxyalkanoate) depolymerase family esterase
MKYLLPILAAASLSFAQWGNWGGNGGGKSLNDYKKVSVSGRDIHVYAPANLAPKSPLLLSLHGMDQDPSYQQNNTHWETVADTAGFVVVYPRGGTGMSTWDIQGDQDTKWVVQIIDQMVKDYDIDTKRVYLSGFSMGGMFTYHAMSKIADKIAAFAPCSGPNVYGASKAQRPVPIMHIHGTNDDVLNYSMVENFLKNYRDQFNCPSKAEEQGNYPNAENSGGTMYTWGPCDKGVYIKHLKLPGRGHSPSHADVSDIWNFVKQWDVNGLISDKPEPESSSSEVVSSSSEIGVENQNLSSSSEGTEALHMDPSLALVSVYSFDNGIMVVGAQDKSITVFNSLGHIVRTTRGTGNVQKVYAGAKGVYIVKVGSRTFKTSL